MLRKSALCTGKIRHRCISNAGVELHIRNQIQSLGQLFLWDIVAHCRIQDQIKDRFHICIGNLVKGAQILQPLGKGLALDLNKLRPERKLDKMVMEDAGITLSEIQSQGQRNSRRQRVVIAVHGSGGIHYCQRISVVTEVGK